MRSSAVTARGFTLLEVMVALTITGLALGGLFGVIGGSKRLAWRAEQALVDAAQARSLINFAQLNDAQGEVFISFENDELDLSAGTMLEMPARKTQPTNQELRAYEITNADGEVIAKGTYWMFPEQPEMPPTAPQQTNVDSASSAGQNIGSTITRRAEDGNIPTLGIRPIGPAQGQPDQADRTPATPPRPFQ
jgi:prepilin-type N-terminal cleavage/methylation domain-containing protein